MHLVKPGAIAEHRFDLGTKGVALVSMKNEAWQDLQWCSGPLATGDDDPVSRQHRTRVDGQNVEGAELTP
jgi:hypothetical protein